MRLTFVLPGRGGGGGSHSVVQEAMGLVRLGAVVAIAIERQFEQVFLQTYPELVGRLSTPVFDGPVELAERLNGQQIVVATTAPSAHLVAEALKLTQAPAPRAAYYIQDYEPLFFAPGTPQWRSARASYLALPGALLFAKTDWLCAIVDLNHNVRVSKVSPSLDHGVYHPAAPSADGPVRISAMLRPRTPRRAPRRTVRIVNRLAERYGDRVSISTFGCPAEELVEAGLTLSDAIVHRGSLTRAQVAQTLQDSDLFLDLSDYQAFGRTGLEAMASGCTPVLPVFGGASEYARDRDNAYLVDTRSDDAVMQAVDDHMNESAAGRAHLRRRGLETAVQYSIERAALSEHIVFSGLL